jgi:hypothetical protein
MVRCDQVEWDPTIYPRAKWSTSTIGRYKDALESGAEFPPIVLEADTMRLLDGKHRLEAYKQAGRQEIPAEWHRVPEGMTVKYYAATLSAAHGDRLTNDDLRALAEEEFRSNPTLNAAEWGRLLGVPERTVQRWVAHIIQAWRRERGIIAWHLHKLGWTQEKIGEKLGVDRRTVSVILAEKRQMTVFGKDLPPDWNDRLIQQEAERLGIPLVDAWALALDGMDDAERLKRLGITLQPYDVWHFARCHELMGGTYPGRIPGQLVCHVLYFFTQQGDLVVDPMAGSGTTLDACLLMNRRARGYDVDLRCGRDDIEEHDLTRGWPDSVRLASLIFWDPPYYKKMDGGQAGFGDEEGYGQASISRLDSHEYLAWLGDAFASLVSLVRPGTRLAFLMGDWTGEGSKRLEDRSGIYIWHYADLLQKAGWQIMRRIQCPLSTQVVHPNIVEDFRTKRRLARLTRDLLIAVP